MNQQSLKRCAAVFMTLLWAFAVPVCQAHGQDKVKAHTHDHGHEHANPDNGLWDSALTFIAENRMAIQIGAGIVLVAGIAGFVIMRVTKGTKNKDAQPPTPDKPEAPK
jgi:hypothetical protein